VEVTELYLMNADGSNVQQITHKPAGWEWVPYFTDWSADDRLILASYYDEQSEPQIVAVRTDGSGQDPLGSALEDIEVSWSPDGAEIAYTVLLTEGDVWQKQIYKMNVDGSGEINLSNNRYDDSGPVWSPDGRWIAYQSMGDKSSSEVLWEVFAMRSDGSDQRRLTNHLWLEDYLPTRVFWP
jgi:Tol biopolymer transport system component